MDKKRAFEILGLREDATKEIIVKRYNVLFKKFKHSDAEDLGYTREELDKAYKLLMGYEYRDPEEERKKMARQQNPNPILKALGIDYDRLSNFLHYNKWKIIIGALAMVFVVGIIISMTNRVNPDFKLILAGEIYVENLEAAEESLKTLIDVNEPQVQHIPISDKLDPTVQPAFEQKLSVEIMAGNNDVFILDMNLYKRLVPFGIFAPLDDRLEELGVVSYNEHEHLVMSIQTEDGESLPPRLYGVDVSGSRILKEQGILGDSLIAVMTVSAENVENAVEYIKTLVESVH